MLILTLFLIATVITAVALVLSVNRKAKPVAPKNIALLQRVGTVGELENGKFVIKESFGSRREMFEGWDVTDKVASLGVNMVPGTKIAFFPSVRLREPGYTYLHTEHNNVMVATWEAKTVAAEVPIGGGVEANFKATAERLLKDIREDYDRLMEVEKARKFAEAEAKKVADFASTMIIIGDKEEWRDD